MAAHALDIMFNDNLDTFWGGATLPSLAAATLAEVLGSLATPRNTVSQENALRILAAEREAIELEPASPSS